MPSKTNLYFIAIIPDQKTIGELNVFKQDFANRFESSKALRIIPHITLKIPFRVAVEAHADLVHWFKALSFTQPPFSVYLEGFGAFRKKRIIYVKPVVTKELTDLQAELVTKMKQAYPKQVDKDDEHFSPHMTIAYRDLAPSMFNKAWKEYEDKRYNGKFDVNEIVLLQHNGSWKEIAVAEL